MTCTSCGKDNTGNHYEHIQPGTCHPWDDWPAPAGLPVPQNCPINGCYNVNGVLYPPIFSFCLDCGNIF